MGSLTGAVASKKVTEAFKGRLSAVGNRAMSINVKAGLTATHTRGADTKVGLSDLMVEYGIAIT